MRSPPSQIPVTMVVGGIGRFSSSFIRSFVNMHKFFLPDEYD